MAAAPTVDNFDYSSLRPPSKHLIKTVVHEINVRLFQRQDCRIHFKFDDVVSLLNQLSKCKHAPNPTNILWGDAIASIISMQSCMKRIGTRGTVEQHNTKKSILAMLTVKDSSGKVTNRSILNAMTAHKVQHSRKNRAVYVNSGVARRDEFEQTGNTVKLCHDVTRQKRDSLEYFLCFVR